jgi:hypothetical protein
MILKFHLSLSHSPDDDLNDSHIMPDLYSGLAAFNCLRQKLNLRLQTKKLQKRKPSLPLKTRSIGIRVIALEFLVPYLISFSKVFLQI